MYYLLMIQDADTLEWCEEFGSYVLDEVQDDKECLPYDVKSKIVKTDGTHAGLLAALDKLNKGIK